MVAIQLTRYRILLSGLLWIMLAPANGQETKVVSDLGLWTGVEVEKTVKKDWAFSLKQELRLKTNMSEMNNYFTQAGVRYRINRNFSLEAKYRFTRDRKNTFGAGHRR